MHQFKDNPVAGDPLIDEIRSIRKAISDQFGNDVDRLCDHLQQLEKKHKERIGLPTGQTKATVAKGDR